MTRALAKGSRHHVGKRIVGASYSPSCGRCDLPPWEVCSCSAQAILEINARVVAPVLIERATQIAYSLNAEADFRFSLLECGS